MLYLGLPVALVAAIVAGVALPLQAGANAQLARILAHPLSAALVSATISTLSLIPVMLVFRAPLPGLAALSGAPLWVFIGGLCGIGYLIMAIIATPVLGAATFIAVAVGAQMSASVVLDHFALAGFPERPATPARLAGIVLIVCGVALVQFSGGAKAP
jgi:bacterial/archaeal transporter family-2 protein